MTRHGVSQRQVALRSKVNPATVNRAMSTDGTFVMSTTIMAKISDAFGEPLPAGLADAAVPIARPQGFSDNDLDSYAPELPDASAGPVGHRARWRLRTDVLSLAGYLAGDVLEFDMAGQPRPGDVVVAQVYSGQAHGAQTVLRIFQPPYLVSRSLNPATDPRPLLVDGERVAVRGVMVRMFRDRAS